VKTFRRYLMFHLPEWMLLFLVVLGLDLWTEIPRWWLGLGVGALVLKDLALFPYVKSSYELSPHDPARGLVGERCRVTVALDPEGWVELGHERWRARLEGNGAAAAAGSTVTVRALRGQVLVVRCEDETIADGIDRGRSEAGP